MDTLVIGSSVKLVGGDHPAAMLNTVGRVTKHTSDGFEITFEKTETAPEQVLVCQESDLEVQDDSAAASPTTATSTTPPDEATTNNGGGEDAGDEASNASLGTSNSAATGAESSQGNGSAATWPAWPVRKEASSVSLSQVDKTTWIGRPVMVMKGPKTGSLGRVFSTASGWVEIHEASRDGSDPFLLTSGEAPPINKRAHELNLLKLYDAEGEELAGETAEDDQDRAEGALQLGDVVLVLDGAHEGKTGKITDIDGDQLTLSIKAVAAAVSKTRSQVELKKEGMRAMPQQQRRGGGGGPKKRDAEQLVGKRVVLLADPNRTTTVLRAAVAGTGFFELEGEDEPRHRDEFKLAEGEDAGNAAAGATGEDDSQGEDDVSGAGGGGSAANRVRRKRKLRAPNAAAAAAAAAAAHASEEEDRKRARPSTNTRGRASQSAAAANAPALASTGRGGGGGGGGRQQAMSNESVSAAKLEATRRNRQEFMSGFVMRAKERQDEQMPNRENLQEWLADIKNQAGTCECCAHERGARGGADAAVPLLFDFFYCPICRVEKEAEEDFCWNAACWKSPVFHANARPLVPDACPPVDGTISRVFVNPSWEVKISPLVSLAQREKQEQDKTAAAAVSEGYFGVGFRDESSVPRALDQRWKRYRECLNF